MFKQNKFLFFIFSSFLCLSIFFNYKTVETTPFFAWGMFSAHEQIAKTYKIIIVRYNDSNELYFPHTFQEPNSMMIYFTVNYYKNMLENEGQDDLQKSLKNRMYIKYPFLKKIGPVLYCNENDLKGYLPWLKKYISSFVSEPIYNLKIYEYTLRYAENEHIIVDHKHLLYNID